MTAKPFYITTAIDYVNSKPHLGTAYEKITADVIARYHRLLGEDVLFLMGNDEHSLKVEAAAKKEGLTPLAWCDRMEAAFREAWAALDIEFDDFIRTTEPRHKNAVQRLMTLINEKGDIYQGHYEGWYCNGCEAFKLESELVEGRCVDHKSLEPAWLEEKNYFFRLSRYTEFLLDHYAKHPEFLQPETRRNEMLELLRGGLKDISISRQSATWGIQVPFDSEAVVYVWFDALINYIAGAGWPDDQGKFQKFWPADLHLIGKDITRFHCVIWPAMLGSAGLPLPKRVFGHGFVNFGGYRMSKTLGTLVHPQELAARYGADAVRWYVVAEATFGRDLEWTEERFIARANADLANGLGNLVSRTASMIQKYRGGVLPAPTEPALVETTVNDAVGSYRAAMDQLDLKGGMEAAMSIVARANLLVDEQAPWSLAKDPAKAARLDRVLYDLAESCRAASVLLTPVMPKKMESVRDVFGESLDRRAVRLEHAKFGGLRPGAAVKKPDVLFPRIEATPESP